METQWSNVKTEYQRRFDLLPNLAEAVKSFKKHEEFTYQGDRTNNNPQNLQTVCGNCHTNIHCKRPRGLL